MSQYTSEGSEVLPARFQEFIEEPESTEPTEPNRIYGRPGQTLLKMVTKNPKVCKQLRLGVTYEKGVTLGNVTMSHRTREAPNALRLSHSTMIGLPRAALEN
ncbi:hypothetical protein EVAR_25989_1 [Eumeta japonica]|uniref:Uncharacterized protein n=1 Tax=Eumeta variegata TaxID=151549 RepID=A0A4C1V1F6_EUMVA|nr:hypothetical protein EVAR_25989_1 [Eumeta japonica]